MDAMKSHKCGEGDNIGLFWEKNYPVVTTYCNVCRVEMRKIWLDDLPPAMANLAFEMIEVLQDRKRGK